MMIELGGGTNPHPRADVVIDLHHPRNAPPQDATVAPWRRMHRADNLGWDLAIGDGYADEVYASHFMEHVPHGQPLINVMNEAWRVLRPGGTFTMKLPLVGYTNPHSGAPESNQIGWQPWADPTHVSYWWFPEALLYFCEGPFKPHANYGIHTWAPLGPYVTDVEIDLAEAGSWWSVRGGWEGYARLVKP